jgi:phosphatidylglycerol:prolipoprotein diacylglycerol transferase
MYPALPFGPVTIPTGPLVALVAVTIGLEVAGRFGRRLHLAIDDVWNTGLLATLATVIVARLWNVIQFWGAYSAEPWLILSLRPSGFVWNAGLTAGIIVAYLYLLRRALPPLPITAALASGVLTAIAIFTAGAYLTGNLVGLPSTLPWALPYFGVLRHPVAFYYAVGFVLLLGTGGLLMQRVSVGRLLLLWLLGSGLLLLWLAAYEEGSRTFLSLRVNQLLGLGLALVACLGLARTGVNAPTSRNEAEELTPNQTSL